MLIQPEISSCSIVLVGQFNPAIFHPAWLQGKGIEPDTSEVNGDLLSHRELTSFTIDTRSYFIRTDRFQLETLTAPWISICDITAKIFGEYLHHTPITEFGINRTVHFKLPNASSRVQLGRTIAPIEPWGDFGQEMKAGDNRPVGGLKSLTMKHSAVQFDGYSSETNVIIEPSSKIIGDTGVYMHVNAHHALNDLPKSHGSKEAMALLAKRFDSAVEKANTIFDTIMREGKK